jgi:hypothetical protein
MRNILILLLVFCVFKGQSQNRRFEFMFGIGNNNQVQNVLNNYFYLSDPLYILDETKTAEISNFKYNVTAKININDRIAVKVRYGHSKTDNSYYYNTPNLFGDITIEQKVTNINPAVCYGTTLGKFSISTGLEFAFYKVKAYTFKFEGTRISEYPQIGTVVQANINDIIIDGGKVRGINNFVELQYSFSKLLAMGVNASYGFMFAKFGDQITYDDTYGSNHTTNTETKEFKEKYFSEPEISVSLILKVGKHLKVKTTN